MLRYDLIRLLEDKAGGGGGDCLCYYVSLVRIIILWSLFGIHMIDIQDEITSNNSPPSDI